MKNKLMAFSAAIIMALSLAACTADKKEGPTEPQKERKTYTEQVDNMIDGILALVEDEYLPQMNVYNEQITAETCEFLICLKPDVFSEKIDVAFENKTPMTWNPYSTCMIRVKEGVDAVTLADQIRKEANPARFGCLRAGTIYTAVYDGCILLFEGDEDLGTKIFEAFKTYYEAPSAERTIRENDWTINFGDLG